ncbi:MAG: chromosome segregation protein ScpA [Lentisphaerae bacterium]|nr:chromosome segregation protein ScpA [Lentisphaerota bacterium]
MERVIPQEEYKVDLEVFEGPLDLLLYLIKKDEVDIYDIPIETITTQYMEYLDLMRMLDLNIAGEFIVMAATLMMIKSRLLLPADVRAGDEEEEEADPRWDLVRQLVEYKRFKDAAAHLQRREAHQEDVFRLGSADIAAEPEEGGIALGDVSLFDLISAFHDALKRARAEEFGEIMGDRFTVADKIDEILRRVRDGGRVAFARLFGDDASRHEIICAFLALLELLRLRHVSVSQNGTFGEICVEEAAETRAA